MRICYPLKLHHLHVVESRLAGLDTQRPLSNDARGPTRAPELLQSERTGLTRAFGCDLDQSAPPLTVAEVTTHLRGCKLYSVMPLLRFLHAHVRVEIDAYADLTCHRSIRLNVNDPCRKTILGYWLPAHFFGNFDEYLHKLAHVWRNVRRKVGSQHGDIYCLASPFGTRLRAGSKPQWNLEVRA